MFSGFVALGLRVAKEVGDVRTANLPARAAALDRLAAAVLAELHDEWQVFERRYLRPFGKVSSWRRSRPRPPREDDCRAP
ncbi:hypothetical protein ACFZAR_41575 [Streptomyces sp. NPDC008222]|uniref:hypothetical protein n=1 Tax=Streptomyces sp. NPDC008222 TaxID=3364820 RepID=UPI0036E05E5A